MLRESIDAIAFSDCVVRHGRTRLFTPQIQNVQAWRSGSSGQGASWRTRTFQTVEKPVCQAGYSPLECLECLKLDTHIQVRNL